MVPRVTCTVGIQLCSNISDSKDSSNSDEFSECDKFSNDTPCEENASPRVTAVAAVMTAESIESCSSKKVPTKKNLSPTR